MNMGYQPSLAYQPTQQPLSPSHPASMSEYQPNHLDWANPELRHSAQN